jgi:arylsulfatase G
MMIRNHKYIYLPSSILLLFFLLHSPPSPLSISTISTSIYPESLLLSTTTDFGWGDVGANWLETKETKNMDALLASGIRFPDFHAMSVCTPSRASLLTGRFGLRTGVVVNFNTDAEYGLPQTEIELPLHLAAAGYDRKIIGKYHLGTHPGYHPTYRGFQEYVGLPYSVDMGCVNCVNYNIPDEVPCPYSNSTPVPPDDGTPALP